MNRRRFLKRSGVLIGGVAANAASLPGATLPAGELGGSAGVAILVDPSDAVATLGPVRWAINELSAALAASQILVQPIARPSDAPAKSTCLLVAGTEQPQARELLRRAGLEMSREPESLGLVPFQGDGRGTVLVCGQDARGLVYALLELADRVKYGEHPRNTFGLRKPILEHPANIVRGNMRLFASDVEDKRWFYDRAFWQRYLTMLAAERFNRFNLALGLGYDFTSGIRDAYFHFAYPFLVAVPGYDVRASGVADSEREQNLETLRFISDETAARGLHFQLGIWTHAYQWTSSPHANHIIEGLTPQNHAGYCRDALRTVLTACPAISGVTFRIHGESGVAEGNYAFWRTVFEGLVQCGRRVEIDMHAKGMDREMIAVALATGMLVNISPKFWAEHLGLPYHQAGIRPTEKPPRERKDEGFFSRSSGSRSFLRYGYGDLLAEDRRYGVIHRIWPGTQRLLLWGDPVFAAGYGRAASFCGSEGMELFEPLSFKGRKGSGLPGGRDAYADGLLKTAQGDFEKYRYSYRLWGRLLYNPDTTPEVWQRLLRAEFGPGAKAVESALGNASRILPLVTTAHTPSAANNNFWPEVYTNMPITNSGRPHPYGDTPSPKRFGTVSPLDPQLFASVDDFVESLIKGEPDGRCSPLEVAARLSAMADNASRELDRATHLVNDRHKAAFRRLAADVALQSGLGHFFAAKLRAAVWYGLYERTDAPRFLSEALVAYREARRAWAELAARASGVYVKDITFGLEAQLRGHWQDRLAAIDLDIADMAQRREGKSAAQKRVSNLAAIDRAIRTFSGKPERPFVQVNHLPPSQFQRGQPLVIEAALSRGSKEPVSATLFYRHTNQAEEFSQKPMQRQTEKFQAVIPAQFTDAAYPIQYYFVFRAANDQAQIHPGFGSDLENQPYYVVHSV
jgi:hypothetical protein